ncbi:MAG TPA: ribosome biogenesis GTP-binding protein YihA/YsxC [Bacteroidales bacterium]|nr:ribosome biogenesis GTP-binding protein YihA/YsxC [Bacteroidales bacterium]
MDIKSAQFISSSPSYDKCPEPDFPEYAFVGRSNVGKSSLINMLLQQNLAKTSQTPGKTQLINVFLVNENWYLADLPGYGYAKVSKSARRGFGKLIKDYAEKRENLYCLFVLIDSRHKPQNNDLEFIRWIGESQIPFALIFTKADKLSKTAVNNNVEAFKNEMLKEWEELPAIFITSSEKKMGRDEVLSYIENINLAVKK